MISNVPQEEATRILRTWVQGDAEAAGRLMPLVYDELRRLARGYLQRERNDHTLQPTGLVHEAYLRLVDQSVASYRNRDHFFAVAAKVMRQILVDHARRNRAGKRGGGEVKIEFNEAEMSPDPPRDVDLVALDDALQHLAQLDARQSQVVELRFFAGLTNEEIGHALEISPRTVKREWRMARAWLRREVFAGQL